MGRQVIVGAGTIGSALAARLAADGHRVIVVSRRGTQPEGAVAVALDASDDAALREAGRGCRGPLQLREPLELPALGARLAAARHLGARGGRTQRARSSSPSPTSTATAPWTTRWPSPTRSRRRRGRAACARRCGGTARAAHEAGTRAGHRGARVGLLRTWHHDGGPRSASASCPRSSTTTRSRCWATSTRHTRGPTSTTSSRALDGRRRATSAPGAAPGTPRPPRRVSTREAVAALAAAAGLDAPAVRAHPVGACLRAAGVVVPPLRGSTRSPTSSTPRSSSTPPRSPPPSACARPRSTSRCAETVAWWRRRRGFPLPSLATRRRT